MLKGGVFRVRVWRATVGVVISAAAMAVGVAPASAATTYHVAPAGSGTACSEAVPCSVGKAISLAGSGDTILAAGNAGTYGTQAAPLGEAFELKSGVTFTGQPGQPSPIFYSAGTAHAFRLQNKANLIGITIHYSVNGAALYANGENKIERVYAEASAKFGEGCIADPNTTIVDSVCTGSFAFWAVIGGGGPWPVTLINDTIVSNGHAGMTLASNGPALSISAVNTIVEGTPKDITAEDQGNGGTVVAKFVDSDFDQIEAKSGATVTAPGTAGNQTTAPAFVAAAAGDFAELPGSATVDAGEAVTTNGTLDLLGSPRALSAQSFCDGPHPGLPDIGAYELVPPTLTGPACEPPPTPSSGDAAGGAGDSHPSAPVAPTQTVGTVKVSKVKLHPASGTATLTVQVSGPGSLSVTGKDLVKQSAKASAAGPVKLTLKAKAAAAKKLRADGKLQVEAKVVFTPAGAAPLVATRQLRLAEHS